MYPAARGWRVAVFTASDSLSLGAMKEQNPDRNCPPRASRAEQADLSQGVSALHGDSISKHVQT